jgi:hypothetical protein
MDDEDDGAKVALWVVLGIITLLLFGLLGGLAIRSLNAKKAPALPAVAATAAAGAADEMIDLPLSGILVVRVLFDLDQATLQPDAPAPAGAGGQGAGRRAGQEAGDRRLPRPQR